MPDLWLYLQALAISAGVGAGVALTLGLARPQASGPPVSAARWNAACLLGLASGVAFGWYWLRLRLAWPPASALDRFATVVLPGFLVTEWICTSARVPMWLAWLLRSMLVAASGRILLHGSVYLSAAQPTGMTVSWGVAVAAWTALVIATWALLARLARRSPGVSIPLALALSLQSAGLAIMLAGYIAGGAAALPLSAALVGVTLTTVTPPRMQISSTSLSSLVAFGVFALGGLLFIGLFFGRLTIPSALAILLAPLLCWATELPALRRRDPWIVGGLRLLLVAIPLVIIVAIAMTDFYRHTAPLLGQGSSPLPF